MSFCINTAFLAGNVTKDPELRYTPSGNAVCSFGMATNSSVKKGDAWEEKPTFHNIVVWGKRAELLANILKKGDKVSLQGRIENRTYDAKDGTKKYISEVIADTVVTFSEKRAPGVSPARPASQPAQPTEEIVIPDDMPF